MAARARIQAARYQRSLPVGIERVWENVLDWEHLPWLHRSSFLDITPLGSDRHGWHAHVGLPPAEKRQEIEIELRIDRTEPRYVTRTLAGPGEGSEIWTRLSERGPQRTDVEVDFQLPDVTPQQAASLGPVLVQLYTRLWDEDEAMMQRRSALLAAPPLRPEAGAAEDLGPLETLRTRLPLSLEIGGHPFRLVESDGELIVHSSVCPHRLGPLGDAPVEDGAVRCPWHGYRFELHGGRCRDGGPWRLRAAPQVEIDAQGHVRLIPRP